MIDDRPVFRARGLSGQEPCQADSTLMIKGFSSHQWRSSVSVAESPLDDRTPISVPGKVRATRKTPCSSW